MTNRKNDYEKLYLGLKEKVEEYLSAIKEIEFARTEYELLCRHPHTPDELLDVVCNIIDTSRELNQIIEQSPSSIYVTDTSLKTLRVNKSFEELTGLDRRTIMGRNTADIEQENTFSPSVCALALHEGRRILVRQTVNDRDFVTAGVPITDDQGKIYRVITNALLSEEVSNMSDYLRTLKEHDNNTEMFQKMIVASEQMKNIVRLADLVKDTETTILIEGETGVGKSLLARYIHNNSNRREKKMIEINCGAIPPALLESELFGYVSGAFTGADKKGKSGLIELCEGGTILLDEIGEMPLSLQVKLLHVLQNKKITRVGGTKEISINVRVIAATNKRLELLVEKGEFREDLYYRLNVVPIVIPPLRERKDDIMPAVRYFMEKYTKLYEKKLTLTPKCIKYFENQVWKGNLRELENCVERLVVTEGTLDLLSGSESIYPQDSASAAKTDLKETPDFQDKTINQVERDMIMEAYKKYGSSYKVAKALDISQSTAYRKIRKYLSEEENQ